MMTVEHLNFSYPCGRQILKDMTGKEFDAGCYIRYLKEKYGMLYGI